MAIVEDNKLKEFYERMKKYIQKFFNLFKKHCPACGNVLKVAYNDNAICKELASDWELSDIDWTAFNKREGEYCVWCHFSLRTRIFTEALLKMLNQKMNTKYKSLSKLVEDKKFLELKIAEINGCGGVNSHLSKNKNLYYSEYGSENPEIRHEDLMNLTYESNFFDLVLNTETLEHIPNYRKALVETHRVLKEGGYYIFTIPILFDRKTLKRAELIDSKINYILPKSYHGLYSEKLEDRLVFWEFGSDFVSELKDLFVSVDIFIPDKNAHKSLCAFICKKGDKNE